MALAATPGSSDSSRPSQPCEDLLDLRGLINALPGMVYTCHLEPEWPFQWVSGGCLALTGYSSEELLRQGGHLINQITHLEDAPKIYGAIDRAVETGETYVIEYRIQTKCGEMRWLWEKGGPRFHADGSLAGIGGFVTDITPLKMSELSLKESEQRLHSIFDNTAEGIFQSSPSGSYYNVNPALAHIYGYDSPEAMIVELTNIEAQLYVEANRRNQFMAIMERQDRILNFESQIYRRDGSIIWISENARAVRDPEGKLLYYEGTVEDVTDRKKAEEELEKVHKQLLEASRQAGRAEVATGVLHNVGNVLNSLNVSAMLVFERLTKSRVAHLVNVSSMMRAHSADLGAFLTHDPQGRRLPAFIHSLAERLGIEQTEILHELESIKTSITHIREIVALQQNYAKVSGVIEALPASELVDVAVGMNGAAFDRHRVELVRDFSEVPLVRVDKHKVLQILINLLRNAKYAVSESYRSDKRITIGIKAASPNRVKIIVTDNGVGIAPENLSRIFAHGFTTKKDGHGFGLHSAALAATELSGSLSVHSDGPGHGATFTLELPVDDPAKTQRRAQRPPQPEAAGERVAF
jgi:PAS domain S-box-containing protein